MKFTIGTDIEKTSKFKLRKNKNDFIGFLFTKKEIEICKKKKEPHIAFAGKFCAKEAVVKALGGKIDIRTIEILNASNGEPEVYISGEKRKDIKCSISHTADIAMATVISIK